MPETMPIGFTEHTRAVELIWIEDAGRRRILTKDGQLLCDMLSPDEPEIRAHPPMEFGKVCEFTIQRFGHLHTPDELHTIREAVEKLGDLLGRPLQIIDTFGWSGEIALAMCRLGHQDTVTIVDDLWATARGVEMWDDCDLHESILRENLGPLLESRIQYTSIDAVRLPSEIVGECDLVFVDTVASKSRLQGLIDGWLPRMSEDGVFLGVSDAFKRTVRAIGSMLEMEVPDGPAYMLSRKVLEQWLELESAA